MNQRKQQERKKPKLQTELRVVYLASNGAKFLSKDSAEDYQIQIENKKLKEELDMFEQLSTILESVLKKNNWGVYYKSSPLSNLPVDGDAPIYKVNDVNYDSVIEAFKNEIVLTEEKDDTQG